MSLNACTMVFRIAAITCGADPSRIRLATSVLVTSRRWCRPLSMPRCPRTSLSNRSGLACSRDKPVIPCTVSFVVFPISVRSRSNRTWIVQRQPHSEHERSLKRSTSSASCRAGNQGNGPEGCHGRARIERCPHSFSLPKAWESRRVRESRTRGGVARDANADPEFGKEPQARRTRQTLEGPPWFGLTFNGLPPRALLTKINLQTALPNLLPLDRRGLVSV